MVTFSEVAYLKIMRLLALCILTPFLYACASGSGTVKERAVFDLECPEDKIEVTFLSGTSYGATGCGKKATYTCAAQSNLFVNKCVKDSQENKPPIK